MPKSLAGDAPLLLRPLGIGDLLDETLRLYRRHFWSLVLIAGVLLLPLTVFGTVPAVLSETADPSLAGPLGAVSIGMSILSLLGQGLVFAALTAAASEACFGRRLGVAAAYGRAAGRYPALVGLVIVTFVVYLLLFVTLLGIPFLVYLSFAWLPAGQVLVIERAGIRRSLGRSWLLTRENWWRTVGISVCLVILTSVFSALFSLPGMGLIST
ncbi:MAG TPA: hypothetical protein VHL09_09590, partial [Dehalococcoidia bacterium]|nr:hypothetical protein [Dehalococcoidia bacterium]